MSAVILDLGQGACYSTLRGTKSKVYMPGDGTKVFHVAWATGDIIVVSKSLSEFSIFDKWFHVPAGDYMTLSFLAGGRPDTFVAGYETSDVVESIGQLCVAGGVATLAGEPLESAKSRRILMKASMMECQGTLR